MDGKNLWKNMVCSMPGFPLAMRGSVDCDTYCLCRTFNHIFDCGWISKNLQDIFWRPALLHHKVSREEEKVESLKWLNLILIIVSSSKTSWRGKWIGTDED
jgi:hypothetical protein